MALFGLTEDAITSMAPAGDPKRDPLTIELFKEERAFAHLVGVELGLAERRGESRLIRCLLRALIANRDLLPLEIEFDESSLEWAGPLIPIQDRVRAWAEKMPTARLKDLQEALTAASKVVSEELASRDE